MDEAIAAVEVARRQGKAAVIYSGVRCYSSVPIEQFSATIPSKIAYSSLRVGFPGYPYSLRLNHSDTSNFYQDILG